MVPRFYVYSATAAAGASHGGQADNDPSCLTNDTCLTKMFSQKGINLSRLIATDGALAQAIRDEMRLRGVRNDEKNHSHIAVVSELDTFYGQALPKAMEDCLGYGPNGACQTIGNHR